MSSVETGQMSAVETGQMSAAETSVLSEENMYVLSQEQILCVSETWSGPTHIEIATSRQPYGNSSNRWHPQLQNCGAVLMGMVPWRVAEQLDFQKIEMGQVFRKGAWVQKRKNGRKWRQNGPLELRIEPRASNGTEELIATDPGARKGRQKTDSAKSGWSGPPPQYSGLLRPFHRSPPGLGAAVWRSHSIW